MRPFGTTLISPYEHRPAASFLSRSRADLMTFTRLERPQRRYWFRCGFATNNLRLSQIDTAFNRLAEECLPDGGYSLPSEERKFRRGGPTTTHRIRLLRWKKRGRRPAVPPIRLGRSQMPDTRSAQTSATGNALKKLAASGQSCWLDDLSW